MSGQFDLSVVIPSCDRPHLIAKALDALSLQEGVALDRIEVVVVLDGDSTGTAAMLKARRSPFQLSVLEQPKSGAAASRERGWRAAQAPHILFLDDDMLATPRLLAEHLSAHSRNPEAVVVGRFSAQPEVRVTAWSRYDELVQEKRYRQYERGEQLSGVRCYTGNMAIPKHRLEMVGGFDTHLIRNEDIDLGFRLQRSGTPIVFAGGADAHHCGYRPLAAWLQIPSLYGRLEVAMYRDRGYAGGLDSIIACWHDRHPLNRLCVRMALSGNLLGKALVSGAINFARAAHFLHAEKVSYAAMSFVYNALYWTGIRDGLRGSAHLWAIIRRTKSEPARPYSQAGGATSLLSPPPR